MNFYYTDNPETAGPEMFAFTYDWADPQEKETGSGTIYCYDRHQFLEILNCWNGTGNWKYTTASNGQLVRLAGAPQLRPDQQDPDIS